MEFDENANLDTSQVDDVRGQGGGGGIGGMIPGGLATGGGIAGLLIAVVLGFLGYNSGLVGGGGNEGDNRSLTEQCAADNPDRFEKVECRQLATFNDLRDYWSKNLQSTLDAQYQDPRFTIFTGSVNTACGNATSAVGPFYCPGDSRIYIDLDFYTQLANDFGAPGEFAQAYVIAHEFGHHIQNLTGTEEQMRRLQQRDPGNENKYSIALELQADCYAGVWAKNAAAPGGIVEGLSDQDINEGLEAARAVGDDRIQEKTQGQVNRETWTHGSSAQREQWFKTGFASGNPRSCDTFSKL